MAGGSGMGASEQKGCVCVVARPPRPSLLNPPPPPQFGLLTEVTQLDIGSMLITGALPTQLGMMTKIVTAADTGGFLSNNEHTGETIPTELGALTRMTYGGTSGFLFSSKLGGTIPTQLGRMSQFSSHFHINSNTLSSSIPTQLGACSEMSSRWQAQRNALTGSIPTQLGQLVKMTSSFDLHTNSLWLNIPTQLGQLNQMTYAFCLQSNQLCSDVPTEVQALSSGFTSHWQLTTGNAIGTACDTVWQYTSAGDFIELTATSVEYSEQGLTGTIPTEVGGGCMWGLEGRG